MAQYDDKRKLRDYLLGTLSEDIQQEVEESLFTNASLLDEMILEEEVLIEDYLDDDLTENERRRFEQHFLSTPERHEKLKFALAFNRYSSIEKKEQSSDRTDARGSVSPVGPVTSMRFPGFWNTQRWALSAVVALGLVAVIVGSLWFFSRLPSGSQSFASVTLYPVRITRGDPVEGGEITLPIDRPILKISLKLSERSNPGARYRVELRDSKGQTTLLEPSEQNADNISVNVPAAGLVRGTYFLKLLAVKAEGTEPQVSGTYLLAVK
jgi:hypothetical protein